MGEGTGGLRNVISLSDPASEVHPADTTSPRVSAEDSAAAGSESVAISLDDLRRAFEDAMQISTGSPVSAEGPSGHENLESHRDEQNHQPPEPSTVPLTPASILEALLFVGAPLQASIQMTVLESILLGMSASDIEKTIEELNESYRRGGHPWHIVCKGGECSLQLLESIELELDRLQTTPRDTPLSQNSIDCLSLIAYRPGIAKGELESLWGQNAGATLNYLVKKNLVRIEQLNASDIPRYFTTARFLEILGVESLDDLPQGEEL